MGPMYIETPYIIISRVISNHMGPMYIETPYIIIIRVSSSHMDPMCIETACIYKPDLALNNQQCHKTKPNQTYLLQHWQIIQ